MRILLAHNSLYFPSHGGGDKSNRLLMEALAARGHRVEVLSRLENFSEEDHSKFVTELAARNTPVESTRAGGVCFERNGVSVFTVTRDPRLRAAFSKLIEEFDPDVILCSTDDPGGLLLEVALRYLRPRVVYLVRATVAVPFGPDCAFPNAAKAEMIGRVDSIVGVSEYVAGYVRQWSGFPAIHVPLSLLDGGDYSPLGRFENEFVLMVNPCAVKGISIFTGLAEAMPEVQFAAVPTWGTNPEDIRQLRRYPNILLFEPVDDMSVILRRARVVLVPSVWAEARSRMVVEAMIRGIPVMASDVGGLHEAKLGVEYLIPVNPIRHYKARVDANMVPVADVPPQDIGPWRAALERLLTDREHYADVAARSRLAALRYAETLHCGWLETHLEELIGKQKRVTSAATEVRPSAAETLSPAKRRLLALRLARARTPREPDWFVPPPSMQARDGLTLFCFPYAGGGTAPYLAWKAGLEPAVHVCAVRLPGRETRLAEAPVADMETLVRSLAEAIRPHLDRPFAFFGHSMGAGIAFELTRTLRERGLPLPKHLVVSSARAPQLRTAAPEGPDPGDAELLAELDHMGGIPDEIRNHPALLEIVLPALRTDTHLYRHYVYRPGPPLPVPLHVYGGLDDPSLTRAQLAAWQAQTESSFALTMEPGGHFFMRANEPRWLATLRKDLLF